MTRLVFVVTGSGSARNIDSCIRSLAELPVAIQVVATTEALRFLDRAACEKATGRSVLVSWEEALQADSWRNPDILAVAPLTFNSLNKWGSGISDNLALGIMNEALGSGTAILAVIACSESLRAHPAYATHRALIESAGVTVIECGGQYGNEVEDDKIVVAVSTLAGIAREWPEGKDEP